MEQEKQRTTDTIQHALSTEAEETPVEAADNEVLRDSDNIVTIEQGRQRRERKEGKIARPDRNDRRAQRRATKADVVDGDGAGETAEPTTVAEAAVEPGGNAEQAVEVPALETVSASTMLVAPLVDMNASPKAVERARVQFQNADSAVAENTELISVIAPLIRHVNSVTEQMNETQINLGRVMAERDALRARLMQLGGDEDLDLTAIVPDGTADNDRQQLRLQRVESRAAEGSDQIKKTRNPLKVDPSASPEDVIRVARRRQLIALVIFGIIGIGLFISKQQGNDVSSVSRDSLANIQGVGIFFNMFFMMWMLYRVIRVGGKGAKWLFPESPKPRGRRG